MSLAYISDLAERTGGSFSVFRLLTNGTWLAMFEFGDIGGEWPREITGRGPTPREALADLEDQARTHCLRGG